MKLHKLNDTASVSWFPLNRRKKFKRYSRGKRREAAKEDVGDDTYGPDVHLQSIPVKRYTKNNNTQVHISKRYANGKSLTLIITN